MNQRTIDWEVSQVPTQDRFWHTYCFEIPEPSETSCLEEETKLVVEEAKIDKNLLV